MKIRDRGWIGMTWYGEQYETRPSCRRKQVELKSDFSYPLIFTTPLNCLDYLTLG